MYEQKIGKIIAKSDYKVTFKSNTKFIRPVQTCRNGKRQLYYATHFFQISNQKSTYSLAAVLLTRINNIYLYYSILKEVSCDLLLKGTLNAFYKM